MPELRGRAPELALVDAAAQAVAGGGSGRLVLLEGEPGIGRSALLERAAAGAAGHGLEVLMARGGDLERGLTFGIARQLLEGRLRRASDDERSELFAAAASHAGPLLGLAPPADSGLDEPSLMHGLFWLCANLAEKGPLCLAIDDAQWADSASLRWLVYMARRLDEVPILLLIAVASGEPDTPQQLLNALATQPRSTRLTLTPLDLVDSAAIAREELGQASDDLCTALHEAARGNPFLVREAAANLAADGDDGGSRQSVTVRLGPEAAAGFVLRRLERLPAEDAALARAVAVLGGDATLGNAGALAQLEPEAAASAADRLTAARILSPQRPLTFVHPVVRATLYAGLGAGERSNAHARAARLLHESGVNPARSPSLRLPRNASRCCSSWAGWRCAPTTRRPSPTWRPAVPSHRTARRGWRRPMRSPGRGRSTPRRRPRSSGCRRSSPGSGRSTGRRPGRHGSRSRR